MGTELPLQPSAIWKYQLEPVAYAQSVAMPKGARVLTAQRQGDWLCVWAEVAPDAPLVDRFFRQQPTGTDLTIVGEYVATVQVSALVVHVYDCGERDRD